MLWAILYILSRSGCWFLPGLTQSNSSTEAADFDADPTAAEPGALSAKDPDSEPSALPQ